VVNLVKSFGDHQRIYSASLIVALSVALFILSFLTRIFALKAQDRAIRSEESLRHFALTGKLLDPRLGIRQVIGLRFASDGEFAALAKRAADENLSEDAIKQAVRSWRRTRTGYSRIPERDRLLARAVLCPLLVTTRRAPIAAPRTSHWRTAGPRGAVCPLARSMTGCSAYTAAVALRTEPAAQRWNGPRDQHLARRLQVVQFDAGRRKAA